MDKFADDSGIGSYCSADAVTKALEPKASALGKV